MWGDDSICYEGHTRIFKIMSNRGLLVSVNVSFICCFCQLTLYSMWCRPIVRPFF